MNRNRWIDQNGWNKTVGKGTCIHFRQDAAKTISTLEKKRHKINSKNKKQKTTEAQKAREQKEDDQLDTEVNMSTEQKIKKDVNDGDGKGVAGRERKGEREREGDRKSTTRLDLAV